MITAKWIGGVFEGDKGLCGYKLVDEQGKTVNAELEKIKQFIRQGKLKVVNLELTPDNLLEERECNEEPETSQFSYITKSIIESINRAKALTFKSNVNIKNRIAKATVIGQNVLDISDELCAIESQDCICIISDKQIRLTDSGGELRGLLYGTKFTSIDFSGVDTSNVTDMRYMFYECKVQSLDLSSFNTSNVTDMSNMFRYYKVQSLDLSSFDTSNVISMEAMFNSCVTRSLDLSSFDTSNVINMESMFSGCAAEVKATDDKIIAQMEDDNDSSKVGK